MTMEWWAIFDNTPSACASRLTSVAGAVRLTSVAGLSG